MAGGVVGKGKAQTTISARVFSGPNGTGEVIADLGVIVGKRTKTAARRTEKLLKKLKERGKGNSSKGDDG